MNNTHTLFELNSLVRETIEEYLENEYWVEAEVASAHESSGHCYIELIQKEENTNTPIAKATARCWRTTWKLLKPHFQRQTGQTLRAGLKVLLSVYPQFHENFGFSWIVTDIDPTYTLGDMARKRQEILRQLKKAGVLDLNKELRLPMFAQRIAVISSQSAAGYGDFCRQLEENKQGFQFQIKLFPAIMQGEQVEPTVIAALNKINDNADAFDCVVIIRGGGATSDLSGFDTLALAENVANFPLPVITGIGHDRDESVLDMVAHTKVKTPTAAATLLIEHLQNVYERILEIEDVLIRRVNERLQIESMKMEKIIEILPKQIAAILITQHARINIITNNISTAIQRKILQEQHKIQLLQQKTETLNPEKLLQRGYSITRCNGKLVRNTEHLKPGDQIVTTLEKGVLKSIIT